MKSIRFLSALITVLLVACQSSTPQPAVQTLQTRSADTPLLGSVQGAKPRPLAYTTPVLSQFVKIQPSATVKIEGNRVTLEIKLPPRPERANSGTNSDFRTQALDLAAATLITATVSDSHGKTYTPVGADGNGRVAYPGSGIISLTFNSVLPDPLLFVELQVRDNTADIPQADLAAVISHTTSSNTTATLNFQTTPAAKAMKILLGNDATRARAINLTDLNTLLLAVTGFAAGPPITYTSHPSLVNTPLLATDLQAQNPNLLTAANYRRTGATVSLDISGLVGADRLNVQVTDAASALANNLGNGNGQLVNAATPGTGLRVLAGAVAGNSTQYNLSITPNTNVTLTNGASTPVTIVATPATVTVDSLSATAATIGTTLTINGSGFSTVIGNNTVRFGTTTATINSASATQLQVVVPPGISGSQPVTVQVGSVTSNSSPFAVVPSITTLSASTGSTSDSITITGTGFSATAGDNTVRFGTVAGTVTAASTTSLTVTVTEAPAGAANATVQVGTQTSSAATFTRLPRLTSLTTAEAISGKAVLIRSRTLTIAGTNFDTTPANNQVRFTLSNSTVVTATPSAATATSLTVTVPSGVDIAGDVGVVVRTNSQNSNSLTGNVPTITLNVTNGGFQ